MNSSNAKDYLPLIQAMAEGKQIQAIDFSGAWVDRNELNFTGPLANYRITPESKLRAWTHLEVPLGAWARSQKDPEKGVQMLIVSAWKNGIKFMDASPDGSQHSFESALQYLEHSTDGGKTFKPCGVMEDAK